MFTRAQINNFNAIKLSLASPNEIIDWSHGEVVRPETINYRTQKPEKDGLFCERIFGPIKDWECYCGKYKRIRYKGIICDKCGVEVTRALVRRERMGHIKLSAPVSHIWFLRGVPSKIGMVLGLGVQDLEKVIYFANFIVVDVNDGLKKQVLEQIQEEYKGKKQMIENEFAKQINEIKQRKNIELQAVEKEANNPLDPKVAVNKKNDELDTLIAKELKVIEDIKEMRLRELDESVKQAEAELKDLVPLKILTENQYHDLSLKYGHIFEANIGAEAVRKLLAKIDLDKEIQALEDEAANSAGTAKEEKNVRRIKLMKGLKRNNIRPEWMILTVIPVIPPDLRPMVPLDGGRFATSDLNDLYRRVINRNNRLKQLLDLSAPEVIVRNEKRMLQEAVDALIDNSARHGKTVVASTGQKRMLKSIADTLKGKQGRFRQNLLGKRIDFSGRSVIVVGPKLKLHECGLPKIMALELFKPFIISHLIAEGHVHNIRSASRFIDTRKLEVWDILERVVADAYVLLNRAPTLHRLGIQAFKPVLIEGKAIQIHPLVCTAFNADFDGDQMAVHIPLSGGAVQEAKEIMLSSKNLLKPATGYPVALPSQDMVWGAFYMTEIKNEETVKAIKAFSSIEEAILAYQLKKIKLGDKIKIKAEEIKNKMDGKAIETEETLIETSIGRILFNRELPAKIPFQNKTFDKKQLSQVIALILEKHGIDKTAEVLDKIKDTTFEFTTRSGMSWGIEDLPDLDHKSDILGEAEKEVEIIKEQYDEGLLTRDEKHSKIIEIWTKVKDQVVKEAKAALPLHGSIYSMVESGARGSWGQLIQVIGMKGHVVSPSGDIIELPIKKSFKEGFDVLEYFISTHGTRKGLSDTAIRTASAGYLTRRLVDVAQDVIIFEDDCEDKDGIVFNKKESNDMGIDLIDRVTGRTVLETVVSGKKIIIKSGEIITGEVARELKKLDLNEIRIRSILSCKSHKGVCSKCYGLDLGYNKPVKLGTAVGIIAAQSIGEPGTQLTMRTFHAGGVAGTDITQGLPRVEELFEARSPKREAIIADVSGVVSIDGASAASGQRIVTIKSERLFEDEFTLPKDRYNDGAGKKDFEILVKNKKKVKKDDVLFRSGGKEIISPRDGIISITRDSIKVIAESDYEKEFVVPPGHTLLVKNGDLINKGDALTEGDMDLHKLYKLKNKREVEAYIIREIQHVYSSQGQPLNDKHIEIIVRQMFSRAYVVSSGDSDFLPGEVIEKTELNEINAALAEREEKLVETRELLLGITRVSLSTRSFLSAASFQETSRVLINAAVTGKVDKLSGLKENVIIGRLIPVGTGVKANKEEYECTA